MDLIINNTTILDKFWLMMYKRTNNLFKVVYDRQLRPDIYHKMLSTKFTSDIETREQMRNLSFSNLSIKQLFEINSFNNELENEKNEEEINNSEKMYLKIQFQMLKANLSLSSLILTLLGVFLISRNKPYSKIARKFVLGSLGIICLPLNYLLHFFSKFENNSTKKLKEFHKKDIEKYNFIFNS